MTPEAITSEWLGTVLGADVRITADERIGDGLVGMNLRLALEVPANSGLPASVIVKLPSPDPTSRATGVALRNYEREVKFYAEIAPTVDIRVARCYHGEWHAADHDFALVLEDLSPARQGNQLTGCGAQHARTAVLELARLHGPRWGDPALDDVEFLQRRGAAEAEQLAMLWGMFLPGFLGTFARYLDVEGIALIERFGARMVDWVAGHTLPPTVTHGDYRLDNLMFASEHGGSPVATVDWQTPGHGAASGDVSYFLGAGPLPEVRREIERELVHDYGQALDGYGVQVDDGELWQQYCRDSYGGIIMAVVASQIVGVSERSEAMFAAMATRHVRHALDVGAERLI
ncbi:MAG: phosphotransferase [Actinomycetota bacterium]|nr:phosphotransferase [Actinomycetota bacterium]